MFLSGLVLWILSVVVTGLTQNPNLIPTVVLLGSFLVPATAVIYYLDHAPSDMQRMGRRWELVEPELIVDPSAKLIPAPTRWFLIAIARVTEFVRMKATAA